MIEDSGKAASEEGLNPQTMSFEFEAGEDRPRLDSFISEKLPRISQTRIRRLISEGDILVNGAGSTKGVRLQPGDKVSVKVFASDKSAATPEPIPLDILFEDEHIIVVDKPAGLLVHPSQHEKSGTLTNALAWHFWKSGGEAIRPGIVHRLDRNTSGVMVVARTPRAHRTLSKHFRERWVKKYYLALVSGRVEKDHGEIDAPIGFDQKSWPHWKILDDGRPAKTIYRVKRRFPEHTLLELEPLTGRTHQLRIHCNLIGHPIFGDPFYSDRQDTKAAELGIRTHQLHAERLVLRHPVSNQEMDFRAPVPASLLDLIEKLR